MRNSDSACKFAFPGQILRSVRSNFIKNKEIDEFHTIAKGLSATGHNDVDDVDDVGDVVDVIGSSKTKTVPTSCGDNFWATPLNLF